MECSLHKMITSRHRAGVFVIKTHTHTPHKHACTQTHTHLSASLFPSYNFRKIKSHRKISGGSHMKTGSNLLPRQKVNCHSALKCYSTSCPKKVKKRNDFKVSAHICCCVCTHFKKLKLKPCVVRKRRGKSREEGRTMEEKLMSDYSSGYMINSGNCQEV